MISTIIERRNVGIFPIPRQIDDNVIESLRGQIDSMSFTVLQEDANISLDYKSKLMLTDLAKKINDDLNKISRSVRAQL